MKLFDKIIIGILLVGGVILLFLGVSKSEDVPLIYGIFNILFGFHYWNACNIDELELKLEERYNENRRIKKINFLLNSK